MDNAKPGELKLNKVYLPALYFLGTNHLLTAATEVITMYSRSATGWPEWEEDNLLPWLEENSELPWADRAHAYSKQFGVNRSVESLRGKKYHILRKRRLGCVRRSRRATTSKGRGKSRRLRATYDDDAQCNLSSNDSIDRGNVGRWLQGIPDGAQDCAKSQELPSAELSLCGMGKCSLFARSKAYLLLQLMKYTHLATIDERGHHFPSIGTMYTGSARKGRLDAILLWVVSNESQFTILYP